MDSKSPTKRAIYNSIKQDLFDGDTITLIAERNDASRCLVRDESQKQKSHLPKKLPMNKFKHSDNGCYSE